ncbi:hypothetical protein [Pontibacter populi]|uniref:Uncharacterized protein n=1 Tax=Pontibacter populi TaxID=890055 RepID=A0ABV1RUN1_9BACT
MITYKTMSSNRYSNWVTLLGAMLWLAAGLILSLRPAGNPPHFFRTSADLIPFLALGLVLVGAPFGLKMLAFEKAGGRLFKAVCLAVVFSSLTYAVGVAIRHLFLQGTGWEPFMPLGFLAFIISWALVGVLSLKKGFLSGLAGALMIGSAISLLTFNDQYNPYGAIAFGILVSLVVLLSRKDHKLANITNSL